jgi:hypothetical protein
MLVGLRSETSLVSLYNPSMSFEQVPFGASADFADNPEPRCPCLLLLDTSGSMRGKPIDELNAGIRIFKDELSADPMASKRVEGFCWGMLG